VHWNPFSTAAGELISWRQDGRFGCSLSKMKKVGFSFSNVISPISKTARRSAETGFEKFANPWFGRNSFGGLFLRYSQDVNIPVLGQVIHSDFSH
jgi:hypothetical protein